MKPASRPRRDSRRLRAPVADAYVTYSEKAHHLDFFRHLAGPFLRIGVGHLVGRAQAVMSRA
jgi:hypothetical protein